MLAQDQIRGLAEAFCYEGGKPKSCDGGGLVEDSQPAANISAAIRDYRLSWLVRKYVEEYKSTEKADGPSIYEIETKCWMFTRIVGKGRIRVLTKEEEITVVSLLRDTEHNKKRSYYPEAADLIEVLVDTGCRLSEVLNLQYDDIKFATNLISIWINKGDKPRSIPMTKRVGGILLARQVGNPVKPFTIGIDQAQKAWFWVRKRIMLEDDREFVMHSLRHTCATRLLDGGVDLYTVKEWLGHSTIQVTERYAHLNPVKLTHAAEALEAESAETKKTTIPID